MKEKDSRNFFLTRKVANLEVGTSLEIAGSFLGLVGKSEIYTLPKPRTQGPSRDNKSMRLGIPHPMPEIRTHGELPMVNTGFLREN